MAAKAKGEKLTDGMNDLLDSIVEVIEAPKGSLPPYLPSFVRHCPLPTARHTHIHTPLHALASAYHPLCFRKVALPPFGVSSASGHWVSAR